VRQAAPEPRQVHILEIVPVARTIVVFGSLLPLGRIGAGAEAREFSALLAGSLECLIRGYAPVLPTARPNKPTIAPPRNFLGCMKIILDDRRWGRSFFSWPATVMDQKYILRFKDFTFLLASHRQNGENDCLALEGTLTSSV
jgi:hypothetical protein